MKAKRINTNAIKGNTMTKIKIKDEKFQKMDSKNYQAWKKTPHIAIDTRKKTSAQEKRREDTKVFNRYCEGDLCKTKQVKNIVDNKGEECKACYAEEFNKMRIGKAQNDIRIPLEYSIASKVAF
tara:strand:- start:20216 stop:20587 length:372 start_codon:yes stop_codon:yes gene_type:complete